MAESPLTQPVITEPIGGRDRFLCIRGVRRRICHNSKQEVVMIRSRSAIGRTGRVSALAVAIGLATASIALAQNATTNTVINPDGSTTTTTTSPPPVTIVPAPGTSSSTDTTVVPNSDGSTTTYTTTKTRDYMGNTTTRWTTQTTKP
jgi:hypothetical protein